MQMRKRNMADGSCGCRNPAHPAQMQQPVQRPIHRYMLGDGGSGKWHAADAAEGVEGVEGVPRKCRASFVALECNLETYRISHPYWRRVFIGQRGTAENSMNPHLEQFRVHRIWSSQPDSADEQQIQPTFRGQGLIPIPSWQNVAHGLVICLVGPLGVRAVSKSYTSGPGAQHKSFQKLMTHGVIVASYVYADTMVAS